MSFHQIEELKYFQFEIFENNQIDHRIFTRHGGVSPSPFDSLNLSTSTGDSTENIIENRQIVFNSFGRNVNSLYDVWQIHSADVIRTDHPRGLDVAPIKADALITNNPDVTLFMRFADCVPILLFDPVKKVIGIVHAGWRGTVKQIAATTIRKMKVEYNSDPRNIIAGIGPSIGPDHYEVGPNVINLVKNVFIKDSEKILVSHNDTIQFNLWEANKITLEMEGVKSIQIANICTACHKNDWYSHRGEEEKNGKTGRFGALIALQ